MSSLTDIIFLLLIFFMLTSSMVQINLDLPESDSKTVSPSSIVVQITKDGTHTLNGKKISVSELPGALRKAVNESDNKENAAIAIAAEKGVHWKRVAKIMEISSSLGVKAILATQPKK
jgi:biopolymer transport protein ExbD